MRNLKRVLSLALASIMLLGMMVIGASAADKTAADLTDIDKVTNKEAVSLMVDLGIIVGKPDNSFAPTEGVDRATMAKLITYILMGDVDADVFSGTATDLKDIDSSWASGYIKYCYSNNIITGDGKGSFFPTQGVTVVQAAKMLLVALGYDAEDRGYQNDGNWSTNIIRDAQTKGLLKDVDAKASDALTRDNAAQMIFNALFATTVTAKYDRDMGEKYISEYTANATTLGLETYGLVKVVASVGEIDGSTANLTAVSVSPADKTAEDSATALTKAVTAANNLDKSGFKFTADTCGSNVTFYAKCSYTVVTGGVELTYKELISSQPVASNTTVLGTSTNGTVVAGFDNSDVKSDLTTKDSRNKGFIAKLDSETVKFFLNGESETLAESAEADGIPAAITTAAKKIGAIVELIDSDNDGDVDVVRVTVKEVAQLTGDTVTKTASNDVEQVKVPGVINSYTDAAKVVGYEGLEEDDIVLYVEIGGITYIEKAESMDGTISAKKNAQVRIDGTYYNLATLEGVETDYTAGKSLTAYMDGHDNIIYIVMNEDAATNYGVIVKTAWVTDQGVDASSDKLEAKILYTDGTAETVVISKIDGVSVKKVGGEIEAGKQDDYYGVKDSKAGANIDNTVFKYLVKSDKVQLTPITAGTVTAAAGSVTKGVAVVNTTTDAAANNNTVYVYATKSGSDTVYNAYTGYKNAPTAKGDNVKVATALKDGIAEFVFVDATGSDVQVGDDTSSYAYVLGTTVTTRYEGDDVFYDISGVIDGDVDGEHTITTESNTIANLFNEGKAVVGLYKVTLDSDGYVTKAEAATNYASGIVAASASGGVLKATVGSDTLYYTYDGSETVYVIDGDTMYEGTAADAKKVDSAADSIFVKVVNKDATGADKTAIDVMYVVKAAE